MAVLAESPESQRRNKLGKVRENKIRLSVAVTQDNPQHLKFSGWFCGQQSYALNRVAPVWLLTG
jgi:hypothetical protein